MWILLLARLNSPSSVQSSVVQLSDISTGCRMSLVDLVTQRQELERARDEVLASTTDRSLHCLLTTPAAPQVGHLRLLRLWDEQHPGGGGGGRGDPLPALPPSAAAGLLAREAWRSCSQSSTVAGYSMDSWPWTRPKDGRWDGSVGAFLAAQHSSRSLIVRRLVSWSV